MSWVFTGEITFALTLISFVTKLKIYNFIEQPFNVLTFVHVVEPIKQ